MVAAGAGAAGGPPLVDAHCHVVSTAELSPDEFALAATEGSVPGPSYLDGPAGYAIRRWCAPVLDLPAGVPMSDYLARRSALGGVEVAGRLLRAAGLDTLLVDTGLGGPPPWLAPAALASTAEATWHEVVRLESVAAAVAASGVDAAGFASAYRTALARATEHAVGVKSILAYRHGFAIDPERPSDASVTAAAGDWLRGGGSRLTDPVLLRFLLWCGVDTGLPVQLHTGFGDSDVPLRLADPALLQPFCAEVQAALGPAPVPLVLLHCYPYHRQAGWLALVYPHVYVDVGLTVGQVGPRAAAVLPEFFELAPLGKLLFSTDAYQLPELYQVGAAAYRHALGRMLDSWLADDAITADDAERIALAVGSATARRLYKLD